MRNQSEKKKSGKGLKALPLLGLWNFAGINNSFGKCRLPNLPNLPNSLAGSILLVHDAQYTGQLDISRY